MQPGFFASRRARGRGRGTPYSSGRGNSRSSVNSPPSAAFGQTLQFITSIKLQELEKQRLAYEVHSKVIDRANATGDLVRKVQILLNAVRSWTGSGAVTAYETIGTNLNLANLSIWLLQAKKDPSFSHDVLRGWADTLEAHVRHCLARFECAKLFGKLFNEWIASGDSVTAQNMSIPSTDVSADSGPSEVFVEVGRKEMLEQRDRLNSIIFEEASIDSDALTAYLADLFSSEDAGSALKDLRTHIHDFGETLLRKHITADDIRSTIATLLASDLMDEGKRSTLREFCDNPIVINEVASVLNMRLASIDSWSWPAEGILIDMRRHLNGKYRAFTDPEILDALFLTYLGSMWQITFKQAFVNVFRGKAWKHAFAPLSRSELTSRRYYLKEAAQPTSIETLRERLREDYFLAGQLKKDADTTPVYDETDPFNTTPSQQASATSIKQTLLHLVTIECYLNRALHGTHTVVRTDLEWFGPSLSHTSILVLLGFFGMSRKWLDFFLVFLRGPLRFKEDAEGEVRTRLRGTPIGYALSSLCGEVVLFAMDFAVNQRADGVFLYRIHDDIWFWDADEKKCVAAWTEMQRYASLVGLTFNTSKTGSSCVSYNDNTLDSRLPTGDIRWGFLKFEPAQTRFVIDQADVDRHIVELRRQLAATKSIFGWINAYNKYMAFFVRNFGGGRPASCFGRGHVDDIIDTLARIQRELFPANSGSGGAVGHLRNLINERFNVHNLPEGYFYFPIGSGGLEVRNPMIELLAVREEVLAAPESVFIVEMDHDVQNYRRLKEEWETAAASGSSILERPPPSTLTSLYQFLDYSEYIAHRETRLSRWNDRYEQLMKIPEPLETQSAPATTATLVNGRHWDDMDWYEKWVVGLYGEELMKRFGNLEIVDPNLIPVGMVQLFRNSRMRWEQ